MSDAAYKLRAALAAAIADKEEAERDVVSLRSRVKLTETVLKEFEEKLCSISEEAKGVLAACQNHRSPPMVHPFWNAMDALELTISFSSPCRHAAEADALREALEWACKYASDFGPNNSSGNEVARWRHLEAALRRRAAAALKGGK